LNAARGKRDVSVKAAETSVSLRVDTMGPTNNRRIRLQKALRPVALLMISLRI